MKYRRLLLKTVLSGMFLALCMVLPLLTGQLPQLGSALLPMHIPVLLCGFVCGWQYGLAVGFIAPVLRFCLFGMPPLFPTGAAMAFELAAYGFMTGLLYKILPKKTGYVYLTLLSAMLAGRVVWGAVMTVVAGLGESRFTFALFLSGAFVAALPGIVCQIILIPFIIIVLQKARLMVNGESFEGTKTTCEKV